MQRIFTALCLTFVFFESSPWLLAETTAVADRISTTFENDILPNDFELYGIRQAPSLVRGVDVRACPATSIDPEDSRDFPAHAIGHPNLFPGFDSTLVPENFDLDLKRTRSSG